MAEVAKTATKRKLFNRATATPDEIAAYDKAHAPRPAYHAYKIEDGKLVVGLTTRTAEEVLAFIDKNPGFSYVRFEVK